MCVESRAFCFCAHLPALAPCAVGLMGLGAILAASLYITWHTPMLTHQDNEQRTANSRQRTLKLHLAPWTLHTGRKAHGTKQIHPPRGATHDHHPHPRHVAWRTTTFNFNLITATTGACIVAHVSPSGLTQAPPCCGSGSVHVSALQHQQPTSNRPGCPGCECGMWNMQTETKTKKTKPKPKPRLRVRSSSRSQVRPRDISLTLRVEAASCSVISDIVLLS